jgi:putative glycosyltransferase (TIGR04372 family)
MSLTKLLKNIFFKKISWNNFLLLKKLSFNIKKNLALLSLSRSILMIYLDKFNIKKINDNSIKILTLRHGQSNNNITSKNEHINFNYFASEINRLILISEFYKICYHYIGIRENCIYISNNKIFSVNNEIVKYEKLYLHNFLNKSIHFHIENSLIKTALKQFDISWALSAYKAIESLSMIEMSQNVKIINQTILLLEKLNYPIFLIKFVDDKLMQSLGLVALAKNIRNEAVRRNNAEKYHIIGLTHYAFGHQAAHTEMAWKLSLLDKNIRFSLLAHKNYSANKILFKLNEAIFDKSNLDFKTAILNNLFSSLESGIIYNKNYLNANEALSVLNFDLIKNGVVNQNIYDKFKEKLINRNAFPKIKNVFEREYITLYLRSPIFKREHSFSSNDFRNSDPSLYEDAVNALIDMGYSVVQIGDQFSYRMKIKKNHYFYDYANSDDKNLIDDVQLVANAFFCISSAGGGAQLPNCFGKPHLLIDQPFTTKPVFHPNTHMSIKRAYKNNKPLELNDYFSDGFNYVLDGNYLKSKNYRFDFLSKKEYVDIFTNFAHDIISNTYSKKATQQPFWGKQFGYEYPLPYLCH